MTTHTMKKNVGFYIYPETMLQIRGLKPIKAIADFVFYGHDSHIDDLGREITDWKDDDFKVLAQTALDAAGKFGCPVISSPGDGYNTTTLRRLNELHLNILKEYEK